MLTPISLLIGVLTGFISLALPVIGLGLLWKATHPKPRPVRVERIQTDEMLDRKPDRRPAVEPVEVRALTWRERWREPSVLLPLLIGAFLVLLPLGFGRTLLQYAFRGGGDEPHVLHGK